MEKERVKETSQGGERKSKALHPSPLHGINKDFLKRFPRRGIIHVKRRKRKGKRRKRRKEEERGGKRGKRGKRKRKRRKKGRKRRK